MQKEKCDVRIITNVENGKIVVRVRGVTSGFVTHTETDDSTIEFGFVASRYRVNIFVDDRFIVEIDP